jgi:hypothetical protein
MSQNPVPVPAARVDRLLDGRVGRSLCGLVAQVPGFGPVVMPWPWHRFAGLPEPTPERRFDELAEIVATGDYLRFLVAADEGRLVIAVG